MDNEKCRLLIQLYGANDLLWNSKSPLYHNKSLRHDAWIEIGKKLDLPISDLKKKMTILLASYRREKSRIAKSHCTGSATNKVYVSKWFAFDDFNFMKERDKDVLHNAILDTMSENNRQRPTFVAVDQDREKHSRKPHMRGVGRRTEIPTVRDRINITKPREHRTEERDEYTTYGELVAMKLKKIGSAYARSTAQYHINNILYKAEIGAYDKPPRKNESYYSQEHSANLVDEDAHSSRSSSPTKSTEYDIKVEESDDENIL